MRINPDKERILLAHVYEKGSRKSEIEERRIEMRELIRSSTGVLAIEVDAPLEEKNAKFYIGRGKVDQLRIEADRANAVTFVFSVDLSPSQTRNLEQEFLRTVIDRTGLILDIFARGARTREAKLQVELAQNMYLLPRLDGRGVFLSRLGGGVGTRGPGEQKLEMDRRKIRLRIGRLQKQLEEIRRRRGVARHKREEEEIPMVALVGYTNAGKSTLLNRLTQAGAAAENRLFTTLDPLARRIQLPNHQPALLADTVGFLHRLPHHLIEAFRATLEEVAFSDLLLHLMDVSNPVLEEQATAVHQVLETVHAEGKPMLLILNKVDRIDFSQREALKRRYPEAVPISALTGEGLDLLRDRIGAALSHFMREAVILLPSKDQRWLGRIYEEGQVLRRQVSDDGILLEARIPPRLYGQLSKVGLISS